MKQLFFGLLAFASLSICTVSCDGSYLDVNPDMGLTSEDVFTYYDNTCAFFYAIYNKNMVNACWPLYNATHASKANLDIWSPAALGGREANCQPRQGYMKATFPDTQFPAMYLDKLLDMIDICNTLLENVDKVIDSNEDELDDLRGQAYFFRGLGHFCLARFYGGWPYQDHSLKADEDWDLERLPLQDTYLCAAADMYIAYELFKKIGKMRRDSYPGTPGHLVVDDEFKKPNGTAALAFRGRMLLYAASPLANPEGNLELWKMAAEANSLALTTALAQRFSLMPIDNWRDNFVEVDATNENVYQWVSKISDNNSNRSWLLYAQNNTASSQGTCPTQNYVDKFETKWGDPLNTEEDRAAAVLAGHFNETGDPYSNRDPRLGMTIIHDGTITPYGIVCNMYKDKDGKWPTTALTSSTKRAMAYEWGTNMDSSNGFSRTGYAAQKYWRGNATSKAYPHVDAFRLAEIYLNYAESANEYGGPDAVNVVRERMEMPPVNEKYLSGKDSFRPRIRNERMVEFAYEGHHYWFDSRRWVDVAKQDYASDLYGIYVTEVKKDATHPNARLYERRKLPDVYQTHYGWQDYMFFVPIPSAEALKMKNFVNNPSWPVQ